MPNVKITDLPAAQPLTGTEIVPMVQNGITVRATTSAIAASPSLTQTFLTVNQEPTLPNSRAFSTGTGLGLTDNGAQSTLSLSLNGASGSLESAGTGFVVKTAGATVTPRSITVSGSGIAITNGNGLAGNPQISLSGMPLALANYSGTGILVAQGSGTISGVAIQGTANQITVADGDGVSGSPVISMASNPILPGTGSVTIPSGTTAQRPVGYDGMIRFNTDLGELETYSGGSWSPIGSSGVTQINTGTGLTGGPITSSGTISIANTGVSAATYGSSSQVAQIAVNAQGQITSASNVSITASSIGAVASVSGTSNEITATGTSNVVLSLPSALTFTGKTVTGGTFNMSAATVSSVPVVTESASQTLTNKSISGSSNTLTNIGNASLSNSSVTIGTTSISLGGTANTLGGLTSVAVTQDPVSALQLATKQYVDAVAEGLHVHASCAAATTGTLASITGGSVTYNNGTSGVGATLTLGVALTILDGYTLQNGDRVLVKNEANQAHNGIYTWATGGTVLTRATDFDTPTEIASGDFTFISNGTLYADTGWVQVDPVTTVGSDSIQWIQFSGAGTYTAGAGLTLTGNQFSLTSPVAVSLGGTGIASGTSGGVLYFSGSTAISSSAVLASNALVVGGGSGSAPSTITTGSNVLTALGVNVGTAGSFVVNGGALGTPASGTLTNASGLPVSTGISGLGTGVASALAVNTGSAGAFVVNGGDLGTPSAGTVTNLTGTASISINGTVGATTPNTGAFTTISASGVITSTVSTGTAPFTVASTTQVANLNAATAGAATNISGGTANQIPYQTGASTTSFIVAPTVTDTFLKWNGSAFAWDVAGSGTVTSISIATSNGFAGSSSGGSTPTLTLSTTITGVLKGNGTSISAAVSGTDYAPPTSGTSILYGDGAGGFSNVTVGSGLSFSAGTLSATGGGGGISLAEARKVASLRI